MASCGRRGRPEGVGCWGLGVLRGGGREGGRGVREDEEVERERARETTATCDGREENTFLTSGNCPTTWRICASDPVAARMTISVPCGERKSK